ncbi:MAG: RNA-directed DNA polymerase, partial [Nodosilinea sp.]
SLDHLVKEQLRIAKYLRYVDDFALFADDRDTLVTARLALEAHLAKLRLRIHPIKSQLFETSRGPTFVGFRVCPDRVRVRSASLRRGRYRLKRYQRQYAQHDLSFEQLTQAIRSWAAHLKHADTWHLRADIFTQLVFVKTPKLQTR